MLEPMLEQFHFLSPEWFWALAPLALMLWGLRRNRGSDNPWLNIVDPKLLPHLLVDNGGKRSRSPLVLLALGWLIAVLALANPTWERLPTPVYRGQQAVVVVLDLSQSMLTPDLAPSRLERARYKITDLLGHNADGQTALVAFAGDAFVVAPLSDDRATVDSLLAALEPGLMPVSGSRPDRGIETAQRLLTQAAVQHGEVLLVADDAGDQRTLEAARKLAADGHTLSVLAVGTADGAPLPGPRGGVQRDASGEIVVLRLDTDAMKALAQAGGGRFASLRADGRDLRRLFPSRSLDLDGPVEESDMKTDIWNEMGPWLALLLLPFGMLAFRRGWLLVVVVMLAPLGLLGHSQPALALGWDDLWQRPDQQAAAAINAGDLKHAAEVATNPARRGAAQFMDGDYGAAVESFAAGKDSDAAYNRGNALAKLGKLEDAIAAYDESLNITPGMEDAAYNKAQVEALLKKQQEQQQQQQQQEGDQSEKAPQDGDNKDQDNQQQAGNQGQQDGQDQKGDQDSQGQEGEQAQQEQGDNQEAQQQDGNSRDDKRKPGEEGEQQQAGGSPEDQEQENKDEQGQSAEAGEQQEEQPSQAGAGDAQDETSRPDETELAGEGDEKPEEAQLEPEQETAQGEADQQQDGEGKAGTAQAETPMDSEQQQAMEQWLRRIPDDPGGLLRRKFLYQYRQRNVAEGAGSAQPW